MRDLPSFRRGRIVIWATVAVLAGGCATGPAFVAPDVPAPGTAMVYVYRASNLMGAGIQHAAALDSRPIGTLVNGSYLQARVSAAADGFADLRLAGCERLKQPLLLRAGQTYYVQAMLTHKTAYFGGKAYFDYGCVLAQRSQAEALPVLQGLPRATAPVVAPAAAQTPPAVRVPTSPLPPTRFDRLRTQAVEQERTAEAGDYLLRLKPYSDWRDAHADQAGFIAECLARKVVGLRLPPPPWHGFALCHRVETDGERSVLTPCSGIGWAQRCEQSGTVSRCRLEFQRASPAAQPAPKAARGSAA